MTTDPLTLILALVLGTIAVGRASRLATFDHFPPIEAIRVWWVNWQIHRDEAAADRAGFWRDVTHGWSTLLMCSFCFAPYAAAVDLTWALLAGLEWGPFWSSAWWVVNAWAAVSYLAAILVAYDEPAE